MIVSGREERGTSSACPRPESPPYDRSRRTPSTPIHTMRPMISSSPGSRVERRIDLPSGSTTTHATTHGKTSQRIRRTVAASTASGQVAYQGWNLGARTAAAASASPALCSACPRRARHHSIIKITANGAMLATREATTAGTLRPRSPAAYSMITPTAVAGAVHPTTSPERTRPPTQPKLRPETSITTIRAMNSPLIINPPYRMRLRRQYGPAMAASAAKGTATQAVALTVPARPRSAPPPTSVSVRPGLEVTSARPATSRPTISASLWAPEIWWITTSGDAIPSQTAWPSGISQRLARAGKHSAVIPTPTTASARNRAILAASVPPRVTIAPDRRTNNGPYGVGVSRQIGATASSQGQGKVDTLFVEGSRPAAYMKPTQA